MAFEPPYRKKNMMPGMIMMWHGSVATIPAGWHLCDGTAGTIDLRNHFLVGAGDVVTPGDTATTNVAANAEMPYYAICFIQKLN